MSPVSASHTPDAYPRIANYFLKWQLSETEARELAAWDLVILDAETQVNSASLIKKMREWNPRIILLAYITAQEIRKDASESGSVIRQKFAAGIAPSWYLTDDTGARLSWWPGTYLLDMRNPAMGQYMAGFVAKDIIATGLWDGVFYDNAWDSITYFTPIKLSADSDAKWQAGMKWLYNETRRLSGQPIIVVGNGTTRAYQAELNGNMIENFIAPAWGPTMQTYANGGDRTRNQIVNIINANTGNRGGRDRYREMRFGLTSALLENGYYSFDHGDQNHGQTWVYDEYAVDLGWPLGAAVSEKRLAQYDADVWRREFDHGLAIVNATGRQASADLSGDYEKIHGKDDPAVNDGEIVSSVSIPPYDGLILLKPLSVLEQVLYPNGAFVRFFHADGSRARNGFFAFDDAADGGDVIGKADLDGNKNKEFIRIRKNKIITLRDDRQTLFSFYPYTANFRGGFWAALGDVRGTGLVDVIVSPKNGAKQPIRMYTRHGEKIGADWWPSGQAFAGGYSVAAASTDAKAISFLIGAGAGQEPMISVYRADRTVIRKFFAFEKSFRGGVRVAVGDVTGDGVNEIIAGPGPGKKPVVKVFDMSGKELSTFTAFQTVGSPGVDGLAVQDVDFDGKGDILVFGGSM